MVTAPVVATVGTSHYDFERLISWLDGWLTDNDVSGFIQHGATAAPRAGGVSMVDRAELLQAMAEANVVVAHGGTGSIMDARSVGRRPVVVPRVSARGENVDDHQVAFARRLASTGWIHLAETEAELRAHLDNAMRAPQEYRFSESDDSLRRAAANLDEILRDASTAKPGYVRLRRVAQLIRGARRRRKATLSS